MNNNSILERIAERHPVIGWMLLILEIAVIAGTLYGFAWLAYLIERWSGVI